MFAEKFLLLIQIKELGKNLIFFKLNFILSTDKIVSGLLK
jgi:hypothetical protein